MTASQIFNPVSFSELLQFVSCRALLLKTHRDRQLLAGFKKYFYQGFFSSIPWKDNKQGNGFAKKSKLTFSAIKYALV